MSETLTQLKHLLLSPDESILQRIMDAFKETPGAKNRYIEAHGTWGSLPRLITALLNDSLDRPVFYITAHIPEADNAQDDLETFIARTAQLLPASESNTAELDPTSEIACERLRICQQLTSYTETQNLTSPPPVIVASITALMQPLTAKKFIQENSLSITTSAHCQITMDNLLNWLTDHGFNHIEDVDLVGDFACRGGIIDIFPPAMDQPIRIEFFGDEIDSIRFFDLDTKRSIRSIDQIIISPCDKISNLAGSTTFFEYLPKNTLLIIEESTEIAETGRIVHDRFYNPARIYPVEDILKHITNYDTLYINRFPTDHVDESFNLAAQSVQRFENRSIEALDELADVAHHDNEQIFFFCENPAQRDRTIENIESDNITPAKPPHIPPSDRTPQPLPANLQLAIGLIHRGFAIPACNFMLLSHHEVFGQHQIRRRIRSLKTAQAVESFTDLDQGDLVVHIAHGKGRFRGMKTITKNGRREEYLTIEYADNALIHVPANKIDLVHKYVGAAGHIKLSRLGTKTWKKQKQKVADAVEDMAGAMIETQAHRRVMPGIRFPEDTSWQREFEQSFPYQDTEDQKTVNTEIKNNMQQPQPMDRLLCGDVGYGKTELALRAVFKAVEFGKQVAVLVPTTVLASQHYRTFTDRLADFPFIIEEISRFKTAKQAKNIINRTALGYVDILIGTHRLLSPDVRFKDLGLIIIDEEQRFGVEHKERLKHMRKTVDILTMTATPLPRTMHMAILGVRDISTLTTPPLDRRSIVTQVVPYNEKLIRQAILQELSRDGQVYFLHNRVHNIQSVADNLASLVPEARIVIGHGQMSKRNLEKRMLDFVNHKADVLVSTTIIESGLDIPRANTIIINDADRFGLAELHQLRGRVGRYKNRAYAYMLMPKKRTINPAAIKRLKAIEEYSQLGSGFRIALRDLEIRGAGNILGIEQSGHIDAIGYELYCRLLASAIRRLRNEEEPLMLITHLELNITNDIPRSYIPSQRQRMDVYRRLLTCRTSQDIDQLEKDLIDLFGNPPKSVQDLLQLAEIRVLASKWSIRSIVQKEPDLIFSLEKDAKVSKIFHNAPGSIRIPDKKTVHLRLNKRYFSLNESPTTIMAILRKLLKK